jgi:hypothetical protein
MRIGIELPWPYGHLNRWNVGILTPGQVLRQMANVLHFEALAPGLV